MEPQHASDGMGAFFVIFAVIFLVAIGVAIFKFAQTRQMAIKKGASESEATAIALSGDVGTAASFLKDGSVEQRVREVRHLQSQGLISNDQAEARVAEILREV